MFFRIHLPSLVRRSRPLRLDPRLPPRWCRGQISPYKPTLKRPLRGNGPLWCLVEEMHPDHCGPPRWGVHGGAQGRLEQHPEARYRPRGCGNPARYHPSRRGGISGGGDRPLRQGPPALRRSQRPTAAGASNGKWLRGPEQEEDVTWLNLATGRLRNQSSHSVPAPRDSQSGCRYSILKLDVA
jgi:hypothetical protein